MVLDETLRLYPPVWAFAREAIADDRIDGYRVRAGCTVAVIPYGTHRLPALWSKPARFDPERFAPAAPARPRYAYLPFGGGPRQCIGNAFAQMEATLLLAGIAQRFGLTLEQGQRVVPTPYVTLRPEPGPRMRLARR